MEQFITQKYLQTFTPQQRGELIHFNIDLRDMVEETYNDKDMLKMNENHISETFGINETLRQRALKFLNDYAGVTGGSLSKSNQIKDYGSMITHLASHQIKKIKGKGCFPSRPVAPAPVELIDLTELSIAELQGYLENLIQQREDTINAMAGIAMIANPNTSPHIISLNNEIARVRAEIQERQAETKDGTGLNPLVPFHTLEYGKVVGSHSAPPVKRYSRPYRKKKYPPNYMNPWIAFVKAFAAKHSLKYSDAIKDPRCKAEYAKKKMGNGMSDDESEGDMSITHRGEKDYTTKKGDKDYHIQHHLVAGNPYTKKLGKGMVDKFISNAYNQSQLGANAGRKFISL